MMIHNTDTTHTLYAKVKSKKEIIAKVWKLAAPLVIASVCVILTGCKTKTVVVEKVVDRYTHTTDTIRDSIRNDVFVNQYIKGDTVFRDRVETVYKYVYRAKVDTFIQRDSIPYVVTVEVEKEKKLNFIQRVALKVCPYLFFFAIIIILSYVYMILNRNKD